MHHLHVPARGCSTGAHAPGPRLRPARLQHTPPEPTTPLRRPRPYETARVPGFWAQGEVIRHTSPCCFSEPEISRGTLAQSPDTRAACAAGEWERAPRSAADAASGITAGALGSVAATWAGCGGPEPSGSVQPAGPRRPRAPTVRRPPPPRAAPSLRDNDAPARWRPGGPRQEPTHPNQHPDRTGHKTGQDQNPQRRTKEHGPETRTTSLESCPRRREAVVTPAPDVSAHKPRANLNLIYCS